MKFECKRCGKCCKGHITTITYTDIQRWTEQKRVDILAHVTYEESNEKLNSGFYFLPDPLSKECPFLSRENTCSIHDTKPKVCRNFPLTATKGQLAECDGVKKCGYVVDPQIRANLGEDELMDAMDAILWHRNEILPILAMAYDINLLVKNGEMIFDESKSKYVLTEKGLASQKKRLEEIAAKYGKDVEENHKKNVKEEDYI